MTRTLPALLCVQASILLDVACAQTPAPESRGLEIATEVDRFNAGYESEISRMEMVLINARGDRMVRRMSTKMRETEGDGDQSVMTFEWPADVKGTRLLTWGHLERDDDQWLYLPSLHRVRRISSRSRSGAFMGSEFAFEDLGSREVEKYEHGYLRDEMIEGRATWVTEQVPRDERSGYRRQIVWTDQEYHAPIKIEFYDRKNELLKTMLFSDYGRYGRWFRPGRIDVENHQTAKRSILTWQERRLGAKLDDDEFESENLGD
ncbi:MAG: outer membrane lipoprotein-sorting protein [Gemmatimonadetes bacterium]|nr:outer membrane lipoprotein-sorting protein [Gemmatimonadota bacterium]